MVQGFVLDRFCTLHQTLWFTVPRYKISIIRKYWWPQGCCLLYKILSTRHVRCNGYSVLVSKGSSNATGRRQVCSRALQQAPDNLTVQNEQQAAAHYSQYNMIRLSGFISDQCPVVKPSELLIVDLHYSNNLLVGELQIINPKHSVTKCPVIHVGHALIML